MAEAFMGYGTTLIAAETTARISIGMNPVYIDAFIERWHQFTGASAVLAESLADLNTKRLTA